MYATGEKKEKKKKDLHLSEISRGSVLWSMLRYPCNIKIWAIVAFGPTKKETKCWICLFRVWRQHILHEVCYSGPLKSGLKRCYFILESRRQGSVTVASFHVCWLATWAIWATICDVALNVSGRGADLRLWQALSSESHRRFWGFCRKTLSSSKDSYSPITTVLLRNSSWLIIEL